MSRSRFSPPRFALVTVAAFALAWIDSPVLAQSGAQGGQPATSTITLKEPVDSRVYQRDINGRAEIPIVLENPPEDCKLVSVTVSGPNIAPGTVTFADGKVTGVPVGGPYIINCQLET